MMRVALVDPPEIDDELLVKLIEEEPRSTLHSLAAQLGCSYTAMQKHLHELGNV
jgi:predicted ArsR family transcriptional regulator